MSSVGAIKGSVLLSRLAFLRERVGDDGYAKVLATMPRADQELLSGILLASAWYPFETTARLDQAIADELGIGERVFLILGEQSAIHNLGAAHRGYIRNRDPHGLLKQATSIYRLYYDTGERTYERASETKAVLRTTNSRTFSRADCLTVVGWHEKAIAMCGGHDVRVTESKCRASGDDACEYVCEWT